MPRRRPKPAKKRPTAMPSRPLIRQRQPRPGQRRPRPETQRPASKQPSKPMPWQGRPKPETRIGFFGKLLNAIRNIFYPRERFRQVKRQHVGTGFGKVAMARIENWRRAPKNRKERVQRLRNRTKGLTAAKARQHARGEIKGVPKYPEKKAA